MSKRVLVTNQEGSVVQFVDAKRDQLNAKVLSAAGATKIVTASGKTVVLESTANALAIIDNATEAVTFTLNLDDLPVDVAITADGTTAFAAESNLGEIRFGTTADGNLSPQILHIPSARRLVMSPNGSKLLVFTDPQTQSNITTFFVIDTASKGIIAITSPSFDQPITAVFGTSDTQAFVLNCGAECGGTAASVVSVDFSGVFSNPATPANIGTPIPVSAATTGLLNGTTLYVAGTPNPALTGPGAACPLSRCGTLTTVNTSASTASAPVPITDGLHEKMAFANNRVYVGSSRCSVDPGSAPNSVRGCLSIFNTSTSTTTFPQESSFRQDFDVTGLQPISNRNIIYVIEAGELDIFDTTTDAIAGSTPIDIVGKAIDAVQIDP
ncbi:MAG TPA: hypothetical protein VFP71_01710 [Candidatus Angelobacter sp.]|nr:hypothetical protein [Candidatus Angelobacter sp.]